ncbi:MAG: hypothetical protein NTY35_06940 [Planctomycetota bacterium]|nr:hypothetical protein [Planctomycetota bacterium]
MSTPRIHPIEDATPTHTSSAWFGAVLALAAAAGIVLWFHLPLEFDFDSPSFNPMVLVPVVLAGFGIVQTVKGVRGSIQQRRFGASCFEMEGDRVAVGGTLRGRILTARDLEPPGGFLLRMRCVESVRLTSDIGSGSKRSRDEIRWESVTKVEVADGTSRHGIPVQLAIPKSCGKYLEPGRKNDGVRWVLIVSAPVGGRNYEALFAVPVRDA